MREAQTVVFYSHTPKLLNFAAKLQWDSFNPYWMQILGKRRRLCGSYIKRGMCECVIVEGKTGGGCWGIRLKWGECGPEGGGRGVEGAREQD